MRDMLTIFLFRVLPTLLLALAGSLIFYLFTSQQKHSLFAYVLPLILIGIAVGLLKYYARRKLRHFKKFTKKSFPINEDMSLYKGFRPRREDIGSDRDVIRELHHQLFPQILETKNSPKNSYLLIIAPPQEGKSTLLLRFAKELVDRKEIVLWANATEFAFDNPFDEFQLTKRWRKRRIFAIIDNIARLQRYEEFHQDLARHPEVKVTLIGASRVEDGERVKFEHPPGIEYLFESPDSRPRLPYKLETTDSDINAAVEKLREKGVLKREITGRWPDNFSILIWALAVPKEENFSSVVLKEAEGLPPLEMEAYCYICALDRFGLPMPAPLVIRLIGEDAIECLESLVKKGVIRHRAEDAPYISRHEVVAESIFRYYSSQIPDFHPLDLYKNILQKATLKEEELMVLLFQTHLERDLTIKLKDNLAEKYKETFSKSRSAELLGLGWGPIFHKLSCYDFAQMAFRKLLTIREKFPEAHNNYACLLADLEKYEDAETHFKRAIQLRENFAEAHRNFAFLLVILNRYQEAERTYKKALELREDDPEAHNNYALLLYKCKKYEDAEEHYKRALELKEHSPEAHNNYATLLVRLKSYTEAKNHYKRALELKEDYLEAHINYAILLAEHEVYREAEGHFKKAVELKEDLPESHYNYAILLFKMKKYQEAEVHYKMALELKKDYPEAHNNYAVLLAENERYREAEGHFKMALELKKDYPEAHNSYANLATKLNRFPEAEKHYKKALELKEDYPEAHLDYAILLVKLERYPEAEGHFKRVLEIKEDFPKAMANLGFLYKDFLRQPEKAAYWLKKAWEHRDKLPDKGDKVKEALEALSSEKGNKKEDKSPSNEL